MTMGTIPLTASVEVQRLFKELGGQFVKGMPVFDVPVFKTPNGTPYLKSPGVAMVVKPHFVPETMRGFLEGFDESLGFGAYLDDPIDESQPAAMIAKVAGQLCYLSFGPKRSKNSEVDKYLGNIKESRHGSVIEHPTFSFILYGDDRSVTHELVRHRVGVAYSQVSQRYVDGKVLRFVERAEYQGDEQLHQMFEDRIDRAADNYNLVAGRLMELQADSQLLSAEKKTDQRKKVNQAARSGLPNETEAPVFFSTNVRSIRHIFEMRADGPADIAIRAMAFKLFLAMAVAEPSLFEDYQIGTLPDGTYGVSTKHRKV